jgi:hypothetical protein
MRFYYSYLSDYYKSIDFRFDPANYYEENKESYAEEERNTYDFYCYLFEQVRQCNDNIIKCDSAGFSQTALSKSNKTSFRE